MMDFYSTLKERLLSTEINLHTAFVRLVISFLPGAMIGVERQMRRREAGLRTFTLICLGSTLTMLFSIWVPQIYPDFLNGDSGRMAAQVLTGIDFLEAGAIIQSHGSVYELTTAACIWVVAVIGLAVSSSYEYIYDDNSAILTYKVNVDVKSLYSKLFAGIRDLGNIS
jgi:putative Mg2+ transporter-C (MgtC) family protein